jgi:phospholipase C
MCLWYVLSQLSRIESKLDLILKIEWRLRVKKATLTLAVLLAVALSFWACSGRQPAGIEHTVIILQENHTFDNYFGTFPGADGATSGLTSTGMRVSLTPLPEMDYANLCNSWDCALQAMDGGKMDSFDLINGGLSAYTQAPSQEIPHYWEYAQHFVLADRYFTSVHGPSLPTTFLPWPLSREE